MKRQFIAFFLFLNFQAFSQATSAIGVWQTHLAYTNGLIAQEVGESIYCLTDNGFYYYDLKQKSTIGLSKIQNYSDAFATTIGYNPATNVMLVGYASGIIDIVVGNTITPNPGNSESQSAVKNINTFYFYGNDWYVGTSAGIFTLNYNKREKSWESDSTFNIAFSPDQSVTGITILNDTIYASSLSGVRSSSLHNNPQDVNTWDTISLQPCNGLVTYNGHVYGNFQTSVQVFNGKTWAPYNYNPQYPNPASVKSMVINHGKMIILDDKYATIVALTNNSLSAASYSASANYAILDADGNMWLAANTFPLSRRVVATGFSTDNYAWPDRPYSYTCSELYNFKNTIYAAGGGVDPIYFNDLYLGSGFYQYTGGYWQNFDGANNTSWNAKLLSVKDVMTVKVDPVSQHTWIGALVGGAIEFNGEQELNQYLNYPNSTTPMSIYDMAFDSNDNLWMTYRPEGGAYNGQLNNLIVKTPSGQWNNFPIQAFKNPGPILVDNYNQIWAIGLPNGGIVVTAPGTNVLRKDFNNVHTQVLNSNKGSGNLPSNSAYCFALDKKGEVWVGTALGLTVFYDPSLIFSGNNFDAQQIYIQNGSQSGYLFNNDPISAIAVDGGNRKWVATSKGVWLVSPDGTQVISQFNTNNSPLISNNIKSIAVNGQTGDVFFATDKGVMSYRSIAEEAALVDPTVYAFPNPVRPGYTGVIAIHGLPDDADVKITDVNGNLAYETTALGSEAVWDGKTFNGRAVNSGVYLVFATSPDGTQTVTTKIVIVR